jgi:phosphopantothenoylcysteine decarboxylase/phosphopantothenate--cysteine ligase
MNDLGAGFEKETNKISIINKNETITFEVKSKKEVAEDIVKYISGKINK